MSNIIKIILFTFFLLISSSFIVTIVSRVFNLPRSFSLTISLLTGMFFIPSLLHLVFKPKNEK